ncbi:putative ATP-dependent RNA helicase dhr2 [Serendipita sp. 399]|nr:putative ATP-dependent RNA helicase dhr2 [Serendipita sp. 399]
MLGALDQSWAITAVGKAMAKLPLEPHLARAVIESRAEGCTKEIVDIVSILSASSKVFFDPPTEDRETAQEARAKFFHPSGDHLTLLNVFRAFDEISAHAVDAVAADSTKKDLNTNGVKSSSSSSGFSKSGRKDWCRRMFVNERALNEAIRIRDQIKRSCQQSGMDPNLSCGEKYEPILKSLFRGLVHHNAMRQADDSYKNTALLAIKIHPSSVLCDKRPQSFMYEELVKPPTTMNMT